MCDCATRLGVSPARVKPWPPLRTGLALLAICLMFSSLWALDFHFEPSLYADGVDYAVVGRELAHGRLAAAYVSNRPPVFPALIALTSRLTTLEPRVALRIVTLLAGIGTILLTWRLVRALTADQRAALLAAGMTAIGIPSICGLRFAGLPDSLGLGFVIAALATSAAAGASSPPPSAGAPQPNEGRFDGLAAGAGLLWALAALTRTQYLPLGPVAVLLFFCLNTPSRVRALLPWRRGLLFLGGWLLPVLAYYALLSVHAHHATITNAYDVPYLLKPATRRVIRVLHAILSSTLTGLPLLVLSLFLLRLPRARLSTLSDAASRVLPWVVVIGAANLGICLASWAERRYFVATHWALWVLAAVAVAAYQRRAAAPSARVPTRLRLRVAAGVCLAMSAASYPVYAWRQRNAWPVPTPAYTAAARWIDARYAPTVRVVVTGGSQTILYDVRTLDVTCIPYKISRDWSMLGPWLRRKNPDVVLIGPDPGVSRHPSVRADRRLLEDPRSGARVGLVYLRSFAAPEGTVHAFMLGHLPDGSHRIPATRSTGTRTSWPNKSARSARSRSVRAASRSGAGTISSRTRPGAS